MLDNLTLLAVLIILFWLGAIAYYFYTSRQHRQIRDELDELRKMLENDTQEPES